MRLSDLPEHARLVEALRREVDDRDGWRWLELSCSLAEDRGDEWSDIDVGIGHRLNGDEIRSDGVDLVRAIGTVSDVLVHREDSWPGGILRFAVEYDVGVQLDLVVMPAEHRPGLPDGSVALVDKDGLLSPRWTPPVAAATGEQAREWAMLGWWALSDVAKYVRRGSGFEAVEALGEARTQALRLHVAGRGIGYPSFGLTRLLDVEPIEIPNRLDITYAMPDRMADLVTAALATADLLGSASAEAGHALGLDLSTPWSEAALTRLRSADPADNRAALRPSLQERIAERALAYVVDPPRGADAVVEHLDPEQLLEAFDESVGLAMTEAAPAEADSAIVDAVDLVIRYSVHTSHPRFLNQNFAGPDPVAVAGDWLGAALNTTGATFEAAPVFTLMESAVLSKLGRIAGYVGEAGDLVPPLPPGLFCPGGSTATLYALQLARHRRQPDIGQLGQSGEPLTVFVSAAGHYAATKSAALLGLGTDAVVKVDVDADGAMIPAALDTAIAAARAAGRVPLAVIATSGTTVTSAFDDLHAIAERCEADDLWLHVDGCYGGSALFSRRHRHLLDGVERSDSLVWNLHKMMGMTQQCTALLVRDPGQLERCFAGRADYLFQPDKLNAEYDSGDRTFQCARRIDVLKLWLAWKHHGDDGFEARIDHAVAMADHTSRRIRASGGAFAPVAGTFTNVVFAWVPPDLRPIALDPTSIAALPPEVFDRLDGLPPAIKARMQAEGTAMVGFQPIAGLNTFRMLFMNPELAPVDVDAILERIDEYGADAVGVADR